jgi:hypothetical protein
MPDGFGRCVEVNIRVHASAALYLGRSSDTVQLLESGSLFRSRHNYNDKYCCRGLESNPGLPACSRKRQRGK